MPIGIQVDLTGKRFGKLQVLAYAGKAANYMSLWRCRCECGIEILARTGNLNSGNTNTCGCVHGIRISTPIAHDELLALVSYDLKTGFFTAKQPWRGHAVGDVVGCRDAQSGYWQIIIARKKYYAHILAVFYVKGAWPAVYVDHENRIRDDNTWDNLREATGTQNNGNHPVRKDSKSGIKGVQFQPRRNLPWRAHIKRKTIGYFATSREAALAYDEKAKIVFGSFARLNFVGESFAGVE